MVLTSVTHPGDNGTIKLLRDIFSADENLVQKRFRKLSVRVSSKICRGSLQAFCLNLRICGEYRCKYECSTPTTEFSIHVIYYCVAKKNIETCWSFFTVLKKGCSCAPLLVALLLIFHYLIVANQKVVNINI